jgi:hypothetical protein
VIVVALLLVGLIVALVLWATLGPEPDSGATSTTAVAATIAATPGAVIAAVQAYDPAGDGEENDELAAALASGGGSWRTVCYESEFMNKPGVGLVVTLDAPHSGTLTFDAETPPYQIEVFATPDEAVPASIDAWGSRLGDRQFSDQPSTITVQVAEPARHLLILFREIGPDPGCSDRNPYRGTIANISFTV